MKHADELVDLWVHDRLTHKGESAVLHIHTLLQLFRQHSGDTLKGKAKRPTFHICKYIFFVFVKKPLSSLLSKTSDLDERSYFLGNWMKGKSVKLIWVLLEKKSHTFHLFDHLVVVLEGSLENDLCRIHFPLPFRANGVGVVAPAKHTLVGARQARGGFHAPATK